MTRNKAHKKKAKKQNRRFSLESFLHPQTPAADNWQLLPWLLAAAFVLRVTLALAGDFVIHPDEIMQYLEPAHRLVFGSGIVYWEYFYGARSWLVPGLVAGVLWLCKILGLGEPLYYVAAVKIMFCAISVLIPWGMYVFGRRHWSEKTARLALLLGVFWYELVGFAHKPMTEFIATSLLLALLALMPFERSGHWRRWAAAGALGALIVAVRLQYAPLAGLILMAGFWQADNRRRLAIIGGGGSVLAAVAALETVTWGTPFHSYYINVAMNLIVGEWRAGESSLLQIPLWLLHASGGLVVVALCGAGIKFRRRGFVLVLLLSVLLPHIMQHHREYRFVFATVPLWLLLFADIATGLTQRLRAPVIATTAATLVSLLGIFNHIPFQNYIYRGNSNEAGKVNFILQQDPIFALYRHLNTDESLRGLIDYSRPYHNTGGYYYLNSKVPFYDFTVWAQFAATEPAAAHASHIITNRTASDSGVVARQNRLWLQSPEGLLSLPTFAYDAGENLLAYWHQSGLRHPLPEYRLAGRFGDLRLWKIKTPAPVREWQDYQVVIAYNMQPIVEQIQGDAAPPLPPNLGIKFKP